MSTTPDPNVSETERERREPRGVELIRREYERFEDGRLTRPHPSWRDVGILLAALRTDPPEERKDLSPLTSFNAGSPCLAPIIVEPHDTAGEGAPRNALVRGWQQATAKMAAQHEAELAEDRADDCPGRD